MKRLITIALIVAAAGFQIATVAHATEGAHCPGPIEKVWAQSWTNTTGRTITVEVKYNSTTDGTNYHGNLLTLAPGELVVAVDGFTIGHVHICDEEEQPSTTTSPPVDTTSTTSPTSTSTASSTPTTDPAPTTTTPETTSTSAPTPTTGPSSTPHSSSPTSTPTSSSTDSHPTTTPPSSPTPTPELPATGSTVNGLLLCAALLVFAGLAVRHVNRGARR